MGPVRPNRLRLFAGLSLILGGLVLLWGGLLFGTVSTASAWAILLSIAWAGGLVALTTFGLKRAWPPGVAAGAWILSVLGAIVWAHFDAFGHAVLSGFTPVVAVMTGIGLLRSQAWAWAVALASVTGFGPIVLLIAPLPPAAVVAGFVLFMAIAVALLALLEAHRVT